MDVLGLIRDFKIRTNGESERFQRLDTLERVLKGTQYADNRIGFYENFESLGEYIPLRFRRPAVNYNLAKIIVDRTVDMLFGDQHFPQAHIEDSKYADTENYLRHLIYESGLPSEWKFAAEMGSVGSVFIVFKVINGKFYHEVINTKNCDITWDFLPGEIEMVREQKKVPGIELKPFGYDVEEDKDYWYRRDFTKTSEIEYYPVEYGELMNRNIIPQFRRNDARSFDHNFGFVPGVWIKNLPSDDSVDGKSTFENVIDFITEIDYQLSQTARAFLYSADPALAIYDPSVKDDGEVVVKSSGNAFILNKDGKIEYLEISAEAQAKVIEFVELLRKFALEIARGTRIDPDKLSAAQSGRALALLHKDIISLVSDLRIQYGNKGLIPYWKKMLKVSQMLDLDYPHIKKFKKNIDIDVSIVLRWGNYFEPTAEDDRSTFEALKTGIEAGVISSLRATRSIEDRFDIENLQDERDQIEKEQKEKLKLVKELDMAQQASVQLKSNEI